MLAAEREDRAYIRGLITGSCAGFAAAVIGVVLTLTLVVYPSGSEFDPEQQCMMMFCAD